MFCENSKWREEEEPIPALSDREADVCINTSFASSHFRIYLS